jgi:putative ABC transport system permease protein
MLTKKPGFTMAAIITLAAGIGLNAAIFSIVNSILLRPLPYREPERLIQVWETYKPDEMASGSASPNNFLDWKKQAQSFEGMTAINLWGYSLTGTSETTEVFGMQVTTDFFDLLGVAPQLGRTFSPEEDQLDKRHVVVISHSFWQERFGGDANIIGKTIKLDNDVHTVIGVLRPDFRQSELFTNYRSEIWVPLVLSPAANDRGRHHLRVIGRLKPGITIDRAQSEMTAIARQLEEAYPTTNTDRGINLVPLHEQATGSVRWALLLLQCATGFVLLIACTNVANLLLSRVTTREKEMAIRSALGASRWRIVRLLLSESLALALIGGAVGLLIAVWGIDLLVSIAPKNIPRLDEISLDGRVFGFTLGLSFLTAIFFGLVPAWQATRINLNESLKEGGRSATRGQGSRGAMVVAEIALTIVLLIGSGLLLRSLIQLQNVDLGFNPENLLTMRVSLLDINYPDRQRVANFYKESLARIEALPEVKSASLSSAPPIVPLSNMWVTFEIEGQPSDPGREPTAQYRLITPGYFHTMEMSLIKGRAFTERDTRDATQVAIINEGFAQRHFPDADPIGRKIVAGRTVREIVGVVGNVRHRSLEEEADIELYVPHAQNPRGTVTVVIRTASDPERVVRAAQKAVWAGDSDAAVSNVMTMNQALSDVIARPRFNVFLLSIFSVIALMLAAVGIYGVMSYTVAQRTREIGVRIALGAQASDVLKLVVGQGMMLALIGVAIGIAGALGVTRLMSNRLYDVTATDPLTFIAVSGLMTAIALLACYIPARRATRVDPMVALRYE